MLLGRCGPCKLLEPALDKLAEQLCDGKFDRDGFPSPQVLRMDSDLHPGKAHNFCNCIAHCFDSNIVIMLGGN